MTKIRVCIIDDTALLRDAIAIDLEDAGYCVRASPDLDQALALIGNEEPHVVLTDLQLPGLNDAEIVAKLRLTFPRLPIVAMSGDASLQDKARWFGADAFLAKPFNVADLSGIIAGLRARSQRNAA